MYEKFFSYVYHNQFWKDLVYILVMVLIESYNRHILTLQGENYVKEENTY